MNHELIILKCCWTSLSELSMNQFSKPWKMMHPYATRIGFGDLKDINVTFIGKFDHEVPSGLCAVTYQHLELETGELNPEHPLSFTGHCVFRPTGDGGSLISHSPAIFYSGDSQIYSFSNFINGQPAPDSLIRLYILTPEEEVSKSKPLASQLNTVMGLGILGAEEEEKQEESKKNGNRVEISLLDRVSHTLLNANDLPQSTSQVDLPSGDSKVYFLNLSGDKLYTAAYKTLYVYLVDDITSPIATYSLSNWCTSGIISDDRLYLGGVQYLQIF